MLSADAKRVERRARTRIVTRTGILDAARRLAERDGARNLSLRGVAAEAGFAPAALYVYFRSKDELLLALAADDLAQLAQAIRRPASDTHPGNRLQDAVSTVLEILTNSETLAAASAALSPEITGSEIERLFTGRMIATLTALSAASGGCVADRQSQTDTLVLTAALVGLAVLSRGGRLNALGFSSAELLARLVPRFAKPASSL